MQQVQHDKMSGKQPIAPYKADILCFARSSTWQPEFYSAFDVSLSDGQVVWASMAQAVDSKDYGSCDGSAMTDTQQAFHFVTIAALVQSSNPMLPLSDLAHFLR